MTQMGADDGEIYLRDLWFLQTLSVYVYFAVVNPG